MSKRDQLSDKEKLEQLIAQMGPGNGFGSPDAREAFEREIEYLKFKVTQSNNLKIAAVSALIGAGASLLVVVISKVI